MRPIRRCAEMFLSACLVAGVFGCQRTAAVGDNRSSEAVVANPGDEEFPFPANPEGKLLVERLRPADRIAPMADDKLIRPRSLRGPAKLENPDVAAPPTVTRHLPSIPLPKGKLVRPRLGDRQSPLSPEVLDLDRPSAVEFSVGPKVSWPSPDVNEPIPLPILARPATDRASLEDPSGESSLAAALAKTVHERTTPAPFLRLTLPDPFENRNAVRLHTPPPDIDLPTDVPRPPGP